MVRRGRRVATCHVLGAAVSVHAVPIRTVDQQEFRCHGHAGGTRAWVLAQRGGETAVAARVAGIMYAASVTGADFAVEVRTETGQEPADGDVSDRSLRVLRFQGPGGEAVAARFLAGMRPLMGSDGPSSSLISTWGEDAWS